MGIMHYFGGLLIIIVMSSTLQLSIMVMHWFMATDSFITVYLVLFLFGWIMGVVQAIVNQFKNA